MAKPTAARRAATALRRLGAPYAICITRRLVAAARDRRRAALPSLSERCGRDRGYCSLSRRVLTRVAHCVAARRASSAGFRCSQAAATPRWFPGTSTRRRRPRTHASSSSMQARLPLLSEGRRPHRDRPPPVAPRVPVTQCVRDRSLALATSLTHLALASCGSAQQRRLVGPSPG